MLRRTLGLFLLLWTAAAPAGPARDRFEALYHGYLQHRLTPPLPFRHRDLPIHYALVGGYLNEAIPGYFTEMERHLRTLLRRSGAVSRIFPPSRLSVDEAAEWLHERLSALPGRLVIVAHSMGALNSLAMALRHRDFVAARVEGMFLLQGPFQGTELVNLFTGRPLEGAPPRTWWDRLALEFQRRGAHWWDPEWRGLESLDREWLARFWAPQLPAVLPAWYLRSALPPWRQAIALRPTGRVLEALGPNDGRVLQRDQWLPGVGEVLADLEADHAGLVMARPVSPHPNNARSALAKAVFTWIETGEGGCPGAVGSAHD